jgi:hypothetical protein
VSRLTSLVLTLVCAATVALAVAGCGNAEKNDYVDQVNAIQTDVQAQATSAFAELGSGGPNAAADVAKKLQALFTSAADQLEAVDPPDDVADLHAQLVAEVRKIGDESGAAADGFASGNPQQIQQSSQDLQKAASTFQTEFSSLIDQINAKLQG